MEETLALDLLTQHAQSGNTYLIAFSINPTSKNSHINCVCLCVFCAYSFVLSGLSISLSPSILIDLLQILQPHKLYLI